MILNKLNTSLRQSGRSGRRGYPIRTNILIWLNAVAILALTLKLIDVSKVTQLIYADAKLSDRIYNETIQEIMMLRRRAVVTSDEPKKETEKFIGPYKVPTFMIIGAQKGGTTALTRYLQEHPQVDGDQRKELHFFDFGGTEREDYLENFPSINGTRMTFDATPSYLLESNKIIKDIRKACPWVKFIVTLRDPVERAYSHFGLTDRTLLNESERRSFEGLIEEDLIDMAAARLLPEINYHVKNISEFYGSKYEDRAWKSYLRHKRRSDHQSIISRGMYVVQLRQWFRHFPRESFLILNYHDMEKKNGTLHMHNKIVDFLGLKEFEPDLDHQIRIFEGDYSSVPSFHIKTRRRLENFYHPYNLELYNLLGEEWKNPWPRTEVMGTDADKMLDEPDLNKSNNALRQNA